MSTAFLITMGVFVASMVIGVPIWVSILLASFPYFIMEEVPISAVTSVMVSGQITSFILLAFPLFSLAGTFMNSGNISRRIFDFANVNVGWMRGGLGQVNIVASLLFAGMSGSAIADISGLGRVELKGMREKGYDMEFSTGITLASSVLGPIIPPSTPMILYSVSSGVSVLSLFVGGFIPGLLIAAALMIRVYLIAKKRSYPVEKPPTLREHLKSWRDVSLSLLTPVIILAGMFAGIVTPTEAAAVAVIYSFLLGVFVYREMSWRRVWLDIRESAIFCTNTYAIIATSMVLSFIMTRENVGNALVHLVQAWELPRLAVIYMLLFIVLILGCFIEVSAMIILILPIIMPIVDAVDFSPLAFGVIFVLTSVLGILTPPFGLGLFVGAEISGLDFNRTFRAVLPFAPPLVIVIILMTIFPGIVTFLPELLLGV
ncbi:MAG: TRAP transporter large permease [Planctomycetota bacterium]|jgi:tripartite ATP-independent transporter DctM subunit|nr:TRAP transporter large permease [Planctomycetota bacterium]